MIEVLVTFADGYTVCHKPCESSMIAQARLTAWLTRFPASSTREYTDRREMNLIDKATGLPIATRAEKAVSVIIIETKEKATAEVRDLCALIE